MLFVESTSIQLLLFVRFIAGERRRRGEVEEKDEKEEVVEEEEKKRLKYSNFSPFNSHARFDSWLLRLLRLKQMRRCQSSKIIR